MLARARPRLSPAGLLCAPRKQPLAAQTRPRTRPRGTGCRSHRRSTQKARTGSHPSCPSSAERQGVHLGSSEIGEKPEPGAAAGRRVPGGAPWSVSPVINKGRRLTAWVSRAGVEALYIFLGKGGRPQWPRTISISHRNPRRGCLGKPPPFL